MSQTIKNGFLISTDTDGKLYQIYITDRYDLRDKVESLIVSGINFNDMYYSKSKLDKVSIKNVGVKKDDS